MSLVIVLCFSMFNSIAMANTDVPIRFRGIEWYTDRETIMNFMQDSLGLKPYWTDGNLKYSWSEEGEWGDYSFTIIPAGSYSGRLNGSGTYIMYKPFPIAGFNATVTLSFINEIMPDGTINRKDEKSRLYRINYEFDSDIYPDPIDTFTKLRKALISVYGDADIDIDGGYTKMVYWEDSEDNKIKLMYTNQKNYNNEFDPSLLFIYEAGGILEEVAKIEDLVRAEEAAKLQAEQEAAEADREGAGTNTDGL